MNRRRIAGVIAAATVVALSQASMVWAAPSVPALTAGQKATVYRALISRGASAPVARKVSEDPSMARAVGVSSGSSEAHGGATLPQGTVLPMSVGSSCSGSSGWVSRSQWINNVYGGRIMSASLVTNFCYNGSSVTYAWSSKSESVTSLGSWGGWYFSSWAEFAEGWYSYNNRSNGGVSTVAQADFQQCIIRIGCLGSVQLIMRTYAHYDGTSYSSGVSLGG
jgi:hypothetical protein